jgi:hypothetical protein
VTIYVLAVIAAGYRFHYRGQPAGQRPMRRLGPDAVGVSGVIDTTAAVPPIS